MRLFFALWPPREAAEALHAWATEARRACGGRVTRLETIHLTLAFLGNTEESVLPVLKGLKVKGDRHSLPIDRAHYWKHNEIVWVGPDAMPMRLKSLVENLQAELRAHSFVLEQRAFAAHITLIRNVHAPVRLPPLPPTLWPVEECVLVESVPAGKGRDYEVLARYALT